MSVPLQINGQIFNYPENRESPGWGGDASGWAQSITNVVGGLISPTDILQTLFIVNNNVAVPTNVQGLQFDILRVRGAFVQYSIYRSTKSGLTYTSEFAEAGTLYLVYKTGSATWELGQTKIGLSGPLAGITFSITNAGQVQLTSDNIVTAGTYTGQLRFAAKTFSI